MATTNSDLPAVFPGFETIKRYWDNTQNICTAKILPGEFYVTAADEVIVTVLGSCISACIRDKVFNVGGMNHFMLPLSVSGVSNCDGGLSTRYGNFAMEHLINEILKNGGVRKNLEIKVFGGGKVLESMTDVGKRNIEFVRKYIDDEVLRLAAEDVGDFFPRKVYYHPASGRVRMRKLKSTNNDTISQREKNYMKEIEQAPAVGEIDLF